MAEHAHSELIVPVLWALKATTLTPEDLGSGAPPVTAPALTTWDFCFTKGKTESQKVEALLNSAPHYRHSLPPRSF